MSSFSSAAAPPASMLAVAREQLRDDIDPLGIKGSIRLKESIDVNLFLFVPLL